MPSVLRIFWAYSRTLIAVTVLRRRTRPARRRRARQMAMARSSFRPMRRAVISSRPAAASTHHFSPFLTMGTGQRPAVVGPTTMRHRAVLVLSRGRPSPWRAWRQRGLRSSLDRAGSPAVLDEGGLPSGPTIFLRAASSLFSGRLPRSALAAASGVSKSLRAGGRLLRGILGGPRAGRRARRRRGRPHRRSGAGPREHRAHCGYVGSKTSETPSTLSSAHRALRT